MTRFIPSLKVLLYPEEGWARTATNSYWLLSIPWWNRSRCKVIQVAGTRRSVCVSVVVLSLSFSFRLADESKEEGSDGGRGGIEFRLQAKVEGAVNWVFTHVGSFVDYSVDGRGPSSHPSSFLYRFEDLKEKERERDERKNKSHKKWNDSTSSWWLPNGIAITWRRGERTRVVWSTSTRLRWLLLLYPCIYIRDMSPLIAISFAPFLPLYIWSLQILFFLFNANRSTTQAKVIDAGMYHFMPRLNG